MLQTLSIQNYALIESIEIEFQKGFSIITGETGSGKSILMDALAFLLGERADVAVLRDSSKNCIIEAGFYIKKYGLKGNFEELCPEVDYEDNTIIRRILSPNGKSRAFINDTPVSIGILKELGSRLVDVHSQHQNLLLNNSGFQLEIIDNFASHTNLLAKYTEIYNNYKQIQVKLSKLKEQAEKAKNDYDYINSQYTQLHAARLRSGEQSELESELELLNNAEEIKSHLAKIDFNLSSEEKSVVNSLKDCVHSAQLLIPVYPAAQEMMERLNNAYLDLKDLANETNILVNDVEYDPERAENINQRLDLIYSLQKRHHVQTVEELISIFTDLEKKLQEIGDFDLLSSELEKSLDESKQKLSLVATELNEGRRKVAPEIENQIQNTLSQLGMPSATFRIEIKDAGDYLPSGTEIINFQFSANKNMPLQEITKVISGGEMSRVMLALKVLLSKSTDLPTIVFDEIDTGVSGDIADKMGSLMKQMSENMQVFSITHLPQIASKGTSHYLVFKTEENELVSTKVKILDKEERITEIAKMLSGSTITQAALKNAKEMLAN